MRLTISPESLLALWTRNEYRLPTQSGLPEKFVLEYFRRPVPN